MGEINIKVDDNIVDNVLQGSQSKTTKIINIFLKVVVFSLVLGGVYSFSMDNLKIVGDLLTSIGNFIFHNIIGLEDFKLFNEKNILTIFYRFDNPIIQKFEYTYVTNEFDAHFIFPISLFIAISCTEFIKIIDNLKFQFTKNIFLTLSKIFIGGLIYLLFYNFKLFVLSFHNSLKIVEFDKTGKILKILDNQTFIFKFYTLLNNIFNIYGGITFRLLLILFIWAILFRRDEITKLLRK